LQKPWHPFVRACIGSSALKDRRAQSRTEKVRQDELDRIPIEGKFGQGKRRFSLSKIMSKLDCTSETAIAVVFLVMNLEKWLTSLLFSLILLFHRLIFIDKGNLKSAQVSFNAY
jgi:hypothetical protein